MAPVGSYESLMAAIQGGADSIYFGIEGLNMRSRSSNNFTTEDLQGNKETFVLDTPNKGLFIPEKLWRDIQFSHNAVLLCLASEVYTTEDYIRDYDEFKNIAL